MNERMNDLLKKPYSLSQADKTAFLLPQLNELTEYHYRSCEHYRNMIDYTGMQRTADQLESVPFLPVQLFKKLDLYSVPKGNIIKTLTSSGTTGQRLSKIYLDKETATLQSKTLVSIVTALLGSKRMPMVIVDSRNLISNRLAFNARAAGVIGFSQFGRDHFYLLDDEMNPDWTGLDEFLQRNKGEQVLLFGFTYMIWQYLFKASLEQQVKVELSNGILIHGGGWKKLLEESVSNKEFKHRLNQQFGLSRVHNYYGMVEQVGSIFMECEEGHFHSPVHADVVIRSPETYEVLPAQEQGLVQVFSLLPRSYPGHSILTEDLGTLLGEDCCPCGRKGKYFIVEGRLPKSELRGCSDTHAYGREGAAHENSISV